MAKFGKWVGLGLGWALGGPIGGILGLAVGSIFDSGTTATTSQSRNIRSRTLRGDYAASLLVLIAAVMKADGRVMKSELDYVQKQTNANGCCTDRWSANAITVDHHHDKCRTGHCA